MRYLKRVINSVLIYVAVYLPFIAVLQALTGLDYSAAYSIGGIVSIAELAIGCVIEVVKNRKLVKESDVNADRSDADRTDAPEIQGRGE